MLASASKAMASSGIKLLRRIRTDIKLLRNRGYVDVCCLNLLLIRIASPTVTENKHVHIFRENLRLVANVINVK